MAVNSPGSLSVVSKSNKKVSTEVAAEQMVKCLEHSREARTRSKLQEITQRITKRKLNKLRFQGLLPSPVCGTRLLIKKVASSVLALNDKIVKPSNKKLTNKKLTNKKPTNKKPTNKKLTNKKLTNKKLTNKKLTNKKIQKKKSTLKTKSKKGGGDCVPLDSWRRCAESRKSPLNGIQGIYNGKNTIFTPQTGSPVIPELKLYTIF